MLKKLILKRKQKKLDKFLYNNREVSLYIGMPRSGKTTYIAYLTKLCNDCGKRVFCNVPIIGAIPFEKEDLGKFDMSNSVILLDEAGIMYDNRNFKDGFTKESLKFLKLLGHYKSNVALFSQSMDIDLKWVRMSTNIFMIKKSIIPGFTSMSMIKRYLDVDENTHQIVDFFEKPTGLLKKIFKFRFWRKPYYKLFNSWDAPNLPPMKNQTPYSSKAGVL